MKTYNFIIQTAWGTDVDFSVKADNIDDAYMAAEKEWPKEAGHRIFCNGHY